MEQSEKYQPTDPIRVICVVAGWVTFLLGLSVLIGWQFDIELMLRPIPRSVAMNPTTALCFMLCAVGVLFNGSGFSKVATYTAFFICAIKLALWSVDSSYSIDRILFASKLDFDLYRGLNNRMAPNTAFAFLLSSGALLVEPRSKQGRAPELLAFLATVLGMLSLIGYGYKVPEFYGVLKAFPMAVHTAVGFVFLGVSILTLGNSGPFVATLKSSGTGGLLSRWLLPLAIFLPIALGAIKLYGERKGLYTSVFGLMLIVTVVIVVFCFIIWRVAVYADKHDQQLKEYAEKLESLNASLEKQVEDRTRKLTKRTNMLGEKLKELAEGEARFRHTLDNMMEGAQIVNEAFRYVYLNDAVLKHGRYTKEDMLGKTMMECYPGIEKTELYRAIQDCMEADQGANHHLENHFEYPDGTSAWFELSIQRVPEGVFILSIDVTDRKNAEAQLHKLNRSLEKMVDQRTAQLKASNKELESFSYSVSHDLRAPLRAVNGFSEMLEQQYAGNLDDNGKRLLGIIKSNALTMGRLIDDLLEFSRTGRKEVQTTSVDIAAIVESCLKDLKIDYASSASYTVELGTLPPAACDPQMIERVWTNLLSNAFKYSAKEEQPLVQVWGEELEDEVVYHIQDNGAGFNMKYADKLFGVFQRLHSNSEFEGTGVGLAIVNRILNKHGGRVWAEAEEGKGATFHFSLPKQQLNKDFKTTEYEHEQESSGVAAGRG